MKEKIKTKNKMIRFTVSEYEIIERKARNQNMNVSAYMRYMAKNIPYTNPELRKAIYKLINEVNYIGHNINQIVRNNNSAIYIDNDKYRLMEYMRVLNEKVDGLLKQYGNQ